MFINTIHNANKVQWIFNNKYNKEQQFFETLGKSDWGYAPL